LIFLNQGDFDHQEAKSALTNYLGGQSLFSHKYNDSIYIQTGD